MVSFEQQLARKSQVALSRPPNPCPTPTPVTSPAPQSQQVQVSTAGPSSHPKTRRLSEEIDLSNPSAVNLGSVMAMTRRAAKEVVAEEAVLRMTEIMASQPGMMEGYKPDPELVEVVKRLPGYRQPVVTLMETMVPLTEESRLREKRGR